MGKLYSMRRAASNTKGVQYASFISVYAGFYKYNAGLALFAKDVFSE